jgi:hypothetical protein
MALLKRIFITDFGELSVSYLRFFPFLQNTALRMFPIVLHDCRGQRGTSFEPDDFSKKFLILDYRRLSVRFFEVFDLFSKTALWIFPIFCVIVEGNVRHI